MTDQSKGLTKALSKWDLLSIGIGAVVGWSWIIYAGLWGSAPGTMGGILAFVVTGILCSFVGVVYAELTAAFPRAGGDVVFAFEGLGELAAIVTGWCIMLLWVGLILIEAMMFPVIMSGLGIPIPQWGHLWDFAGFPVYFSYILVSFVANFFFAFINFRGVQVSGRFQTIAVIIMLAAAVFFCLSGVAVGSPANAKPLFTDFKGLSLVLLMVPGFMSGFNAIPQAAEESNVPGKTLGRMVVYTVWASVAFYILIVVGLSLAAPLDIRAGEGLVVAKAVDYMFNGAPAARIFVTFASLLGMLTTWNASYIAGSRLIFGLSRAKFIPNQLAEIHPKYGTPAKIIWLLFGLSTIWTLLGTSQPLYVGIVDVFSFFLVVAWLIVCISFMKLRASQPDLARPYKVPAYKVMGSLAIIFSILFLLLYTPLNPFGGLTRGETIASLCIILVGVIVYFTWNKRGGQLPLEERKKLLQEARV